MLFTLGYKRLDLNILMSQLFNNLATVLRHLGDLKQGTESHQRALDIILQVL